MQIVFKDRYFKNKINIKKNHTDNIYTYILCILIHCISNTANSSKRNPRN